MLEKHGRGEEWGSTSYGGLTRVRFGGSIPRAGKSRPGERRAPLSYVGKGWMVMGGVSSERVNGDLPFFMRKQAFDHL